MTDSDSARSGPLTIWTSVRLPGSAAALLHDQVGKHRVVYAPAPDGPDPAASAPATALATADIAFGQPAPDDLRALARLCWVHLSTAGHTRYDGDDVRAALRARGAALTTSSAVYAEPCAQHALAMMLALGRQLPRALDEQRTARGWLHHQLRQASRLLADETVLLLGFGAIGRRLAELLAPFRVEVVALLRHPAGAARSPGRSPVRVIVEDELPAWLARADHVVNVLPANAGTAGFVDTSRIRAMRPGARFYNVGRGSTVDQDALRAALVDGHLGGAYLDVTEPEPLPPDHPLWTTPGCHITPHTAGGHEREAEALVRHFLANLRRFESGAPLLDRVV